ncbi:MAG: hypothetical protein JWO92_327 [Chitinophagaceae bacterium]|nr:hypothetical protein [Chitinophagaceae bacterium]MDB5222302.1 hypothetical protein [Chitinophagaceae bacterium]
MKQLLLIIAFFLGSFSLVKAQNDRENRFEKVQALKIAFITQKLELTTDEAQKFWPVYNRYEAEIRQMMMDNKGVGDAIENEEKLLNVKKKYKSEFTKVVGPAKTNTLFNSEKEFRSVLMRQLKNKHQ